MQNLQDTRKSEHEPEMPTNQEIMDICTISKAATNLNARAKHIALNIRDAKSMTNTEQARQWIERAQTQLRPYFNELLEVEWLVSKYPDLKNSFYKAKLNAEKLLAE